MLDLFTARYPYTDYHELNLDWLISKVIAMNIKLDNFVSLNTIKYADPIGWDITKQYEANTVVLDQNTGIAYLSSQPVPAGVSISNPDYWSVIFDLQQIIGSINENITYHNDGTSPTTTFTLAVGDWVLWNSKLYKVIQAMSPGYAYIEGSNIEAHSVEELVKELITSIYVYIGELTDLATTDTTSVVNAINSLVSDLNTAVNDINNTIGDLSTLTTSDITSVVNAINSLVTDLNTAVNDINNNMGDLNDLATTDQSSIVNALNELVSNVGALNSLTTVDKSSVVNAINEIDARVNSIKTIYVNVKDYGAVGDGVTDDTVAINDALTVAKSYNLGATLFFPAGEYKISNTIVIPYMTGNGLGGISILGEGRYSSVIFSELDIDLIQYIGDATDPDDAYNLFGISIQNVYLRYLGGASTHTGISFTNCHQVYMANVRVRYFKTGVYLSHCPNSVFFAVGISANVANARGFDVGDRSVSNFYIGCFFAASGNATGLNNGACGFWADRGNISDQNIMYFDVGGSCVEAIHLNGINTVTNQTGDINIIDLVCETYYGVSAYNINRHGNLNIIGGWFNCTGERAGVYLTSCSGVSITSAKFVNNIGSGDVGSKCAVRCITRVDNLTINGCTILNQYALDANVAGNGIVFNNNIVHLETGVTCQGSLAGTNASHSMLMGNVFKGVTLRYARLYSSATYSIMSFNIGNGEATGTAYQNDAGASCVVSNNIDG